MVKAQKVVIVKTTDVLACRQALKKLCDQSVSLKTAQKFLELEKYATKIATEFGESRDKVAQEKGGEFVKGVLKLTGDAKDSFTKQINVILETEVKIPLKLCVYLADVAEAKISAHDLGDISFLVIDME